MKVRVTFSTGGGRKKEGEGRGTGERSGEKVFTLGGGARGREKHASNEVRENV